MVRCACDSSFSESVACLTAGVCTRNDLCFGDIAFMFLPGPYRAHRLLLSLASPQRRASAHSGALSAASEAPAMYSRLLQCMH